jgi:HlyD family secretion protein
VVFLRRRSSADTNAAADEPPAGHTRKEMEGVFLVRDKTVVFTPVKIGIAGEKYFEVLEGLKAGDQVVTGPFANVRELADVLHRLHHGLHLPPLLTPVAAA